MTITNLETIRKERGFRLGGMEESTSYIAKLGKGRRALAIATFQELVSILGIVSSLVIRVGPGETEGIAEGVNCVPRPR